MKPIIKWPGGKSREIDEIQHLIPAYDRYIEPFFGGGALFFHLAPEKAVINDISGALMWFYELVKAGDRQLYELLLCYSRSFSALVSLCEQQALELFHLFFRLKEGLVTETDLGLELSGLSARLTEQLGEPFARCLLLDRQAFEDHLCRMAEDKLRRTVKHYEKRPFTTEDLRDNLITGFTSGYYMYFRKVFNDLALGRTAAPSPAYETANFYFIREYCYGSMFRYNARGEFNIPYGGMSYNRKDMEAKVHAMFSGDMQKLFSGAELYCCDFDELLRQVPLTETDFLFLDPPYDTDFSDYEGMDFTRGDQGRLAEALKRTRAKFILVIKNTEFIRGLYEGHFRILSFDKQYSYNVRSRNERLSEHLIITNLPE